ncbi:hypothetical protein DPMN_109909 [Dreissena polymorpha]|uniref:Uncharacterized protein n=1 Tax=Dreissena polymorpha TaxID=45954 RepID=A0A9D4QNE2_DREPO|nr:hypothetical protein DPMN_109909 [Dreissena polymorpha]
MNNKWPHGGNVFQQTGTIFELFHEDPTINVASTVLTRQKFMTHNGRQTIDKSILKIVPKPTMTNRALIWLINCSHYIHIEKTAPPPGRHVFPPIWTIFELSRHIQKTHVLTKFYEDWTKNVTRVFTCFHYIHIEKTAPPPGIHVFFHRSGPFLNSSEISIKPMASSRVFTRNTAPPPGGHVFQGTGTIFTNILTKLHDDWASNVTSTVFTSFELSRGINGTNVLTKFHEDRTINVASGVFTRQMLTAHDGQKPLTKAHHEHVVLR